jgi:hypothetical protein
MSSLDPSLQPWQSIVPRQQVEIGFVVIDVVYHGRLYSECSEAEMLGLKELVRQAFQTIAEFRNGKVYHWTADGGAFMFLLEDAAGFDLCCLTAIQMLEMMPSLYQDVRPSADIDCPIEVRIACDAGWMTYDPEPRNSSGEFVGKMLKYKRQVSLANKVTITDRLYAQLSRSFKSRFASWKRSAEVEAELYCTPPLSLAVGSPEGIISASKSTVEVPALQPPAPTSPREDRPAAESPPRAVGAGRGRWALKAVVGLLAVVLVGLLAAKSLLPMVAPSPPPAWNEPVRSAEWLGWRKQTHDKLSGAVNEETLSQALKTLPLASAEDPATALRRDQAVADVLLSYDGVQTILKKRLGIARDSFLGTGLSKPVGERDYSSASVHEYLIPNHPDTHPEVWTWQLQPIGPNFRKRVRDIIAGDPDKKEQRLPPLLGSKETFEQNLTAGILSRVEKKDMNLPPVIRFAIFPAKFYSNKMGRKDAIRVFACNLAELWDLPLQEAAKHSGYSFGAGSREGDTFFIWVFLPNRQDEVVPATWGEVLRRLPKWLEEEGSANR